MKNLTLLLLTCILFTSCDYDIDRPIKKNSPLTIKAFKNDNNNLVKYEASNQGYYNVVYFIDTIGAFKIGDTVILKNIKK